MKPIHIALLKLASRPILSGGHKFKSVQICFSNSVCVNWVLGNTKEYQYVYANSNGTVTSVTITATEDPYESEPGACPGFRDVKIYTLPVVKGRYCTLGVQMNRGMFIVLGFLAQKVQNF